MPLEKKKWGRRIFGILTCWKKTCYRYCRNSNSLKLMFLLIPKHFLSVWTSLLSQREIFWSTCPNLPNAKFSFRSIPNFFQGMKIYWDRIFVVLVQWSHGWPLEFKKFLISIKGFASYRCFSQHFWPKMEKNCPFQFFPEVSEYYFSFFFMRVLVTCQSSNVKKIVKK